MPITTGALQNDVCNLYLGFATTWSSGASHKLMLYSGTPPANARAALSGNVAVATIAGIAWTTPANGASLVSASTPDNNAVGGTATFFRLYRATATDPGDVIVQGSVGTSGADLNLNNTTIAAGANVSLTSGAFTAPQ